MDEFVSDPAPGPLDRRYLEWLRELVAAMQQRQPERGEYLSEDELRSGRHSMLTLSREQLHHAAMLWLYDSDRIFWFDWPEWGEGRRVFQDWNDTTAASLDHLTVRKLITAVARNDRFNEGAWEGFIQVGEGPQLFSRLLELEEELAANPGS